MSGRVGPWVRQNTRRLIALALAPGLLTLAFEAYVGHYVGSEKSGGAALQPAPVWFGVAAFLVLLPICALPMPKFRIGVKVVGVVSFLVGAVGVLIHVWSFLEQMVKQKVMDETGEAFTDALDSVLGSAPPAFAPGAYAMIGLILYALGSRWVLLRMRTPEKRAGK